MSLRFIIKHRTTDAHVGPETVVWRTLDAEVPELEHLLRRGGYSSTGYDFTEVVGVEVSDNSPEVTDG